MFFKRIVMIAAVMALAACAPTRQMVNLAPQIPQAEASVNPELNIALQVEDVRGDPRLGQRGDVALYTQQDVSYLLHEALAPALAARRIQIVAGENPRTLTVLIKSLKLESAGGHWTAEAELGSVAHNGMAQYKANYRVEKDKKTLLNPGAREAEQILNELLNNALQKLVNDAGLVAFLSK